MRVLFLLFIALPILELYLLFKVGGVIGFLPTVAVVLATGALGVHVLRRQSFSTLQRAQAKMQSGQLPGQEIIEGMFIAVGGALLLTPGFITDFIAIFFLLPFTRRPLVRYLLDSGKLSAFAQQSGSGFTFMHMGGRGPQRPAGGHDVYEGEFTRENPGRTPISNDQLTRDDSTEGNLEGQKQKGSE